MPTVAVLLAFGAVIRESVPVPAFGDDAAYILRCPRIETVVSSAVLQARDYLGRRLAALDSAAALSAAAGLLSEELTAAAAAKATSAGAESDPLVFLSMLWSARTAPGVRVVAARSGRPGGVLFSSRVSVCPRNDAPRVGAKAA